jgi:hypothetical protein
VRVVIVDGHQMFRSGVRAELGAHGYVTKAVSGQELTSAIIRVAGGDAVFSPRLAGFVLDAFAGAGPGGGSLHGGSLPSWIR